jgi:hypothetical protein
VLAYLLGALKRSLCGLTGHRPGMPEVFGRDRVAECRRCLEVVVLPPLIDHETLNRARRASARAWLEEHGGKLPAYKSANVAESLDSIERDAVTK